MPVVLSRHFAFPLHRGYDYITDPKRWPEYWPDVVELAPGSRWSEPGDTARLTLRLLGRPTELELTLRRVLPYRLIEYTSVQHGLPAARHERHFVAERAGFEYRIVVELEPRGGLRGPFDRLVVSRAVGRAARQTVTNLEQRFAEQRESATEHRRTVHEVAEAIAAGWERRRPRIEAGVAPVREWMLRALAPPPGATVLELAAGAGDTGYEAVAIAGERGRLISTDVSPAMVDVARRRAAELGLHDVDHRVMDAERIELDAEAVDGVLCRFGYMLMADPAAALAETRRVLRPGGRLALSVWGAPERNPWMTILARTLIARGHLPPPEPGGPDPFSMAREEHTRGLLEAAGFTAVRIEEVPVAFAFADVDDYLGYVADTAGPLALVLRGLTEADRTALGSQLREAFAPFLADDGYEIPGLALTAAATPDERSRR